MSVHSVVYKPNRLEWKLRRKSKPLCKFPAMFHTFDTFVTKLGRKFADASAKSLEISIKDAERFPNDKDKILSSENLECLVYSYATFDPEVAMNHLQSVEKNLNRLKEDIIFIFKVWLMGECTEDNEESKLEFGDEIRFVTLIQKYDLPDFLIGVTGLLFPDITCSIALKQPNTVLAQKGYLKDYKNFKLIHMWCCYITMLPNGTKYGGFVKAILHMETNKEEEEKDTFLWPPKHSSIINSIALLRSAFNNNFISQEKRLEFFESLNLKEDDCVSWSQTFDRHFPEHAYVHKLFEQIA